MNPIGPRAPGEVMDFFFQQLRSLSARRERQKGLVLSRLHWELTGKPHHRAKRHRLCSYHLRQNRAGMITYRDMGGKPESPRRQLNDGLVCVVLCVLGLGELEGLGVGRVSCLDPGYADILCHG